MAVTSRAHYELAQRDFHRARQQAVMQQMLARLRGEQDRLLPFHAVRQQLHDTGEQIDHGIREIPLNKIVGSVDRYDDFTRSFLPKKRGDEERWTGVRAAVDSMVGMPPIDVYQIGDSYFVQDGNHRVSIARTLGTDTITARVTEVKTRVPLRAEDDPQELLCKAHYADFLEKTNIDVLRPDADLLLTFCTEYDVLLGQIEAEYRRLQQDPQRRGKVDLWQRAVTNWYDNVYQPVARVVAELGVLKRFPERTEADMFVLLSERQAELENELGWRLDLETGVSDLLNTADDQPGLIGRVVRSLAVQAEDGPTPGIWRQQQQARQRSNHLFEHLLLPLDDTKGGWQLFDHVLRIATQDHDHILGLHVVATEAERDGERVQKMRERFEQGVREADLRGQFAVEVAPSPVDVLVRRAAWVDCIIVNRSPPPAGQPANYLSPRLKALVEQCPRPLEICPDGKFYRTDRALLAYDGSPRSDEALFIAAYFCARYNKMLTVVTVETQFTPAATLERARSYLRKRGIGNAKYVLRHGAIAENVLAVAREHESNLLFLGGFSFPSLRHLRLGSAAVGILREFRHPIWICR